MPEKDYKVVYKTRVLDRDEPRPQIPTALDPYDNSYNMERFGRDRDRLSARNSTSNLDDRSGSTEVARRSASRSSYSTRDDGRSREAFGNARKSSRGEMSSKTSRSDVRRSTVVDQGRDEAPARRSNSSLGARSNRNRASIDVERSRGRDEEHYLDDRSRTRPVGAPYVIETRQGDTVDVYTSPRNRSRILERDERRHADVASSPKRNYYERPYDRDRPDRMSRPSEVLRDPDVVVVERDYPQGLPYQGEERRSSRPITRDYRRDREEDWRLVESMRDTRLDSTPSRGGQPQPTPRSRAQTYSSEDSYVMVSPTQKSQPQQSFPSETQESRPSEARSIRSAMARTDRPEPELRRRRSRSISFRDSQANQHECGQQRHERPGAEAEIGGRFLSRPVSDDDDTSDIYGVVNAPHKDYRFSRNPDPYEATYRQRDIPYGPQVGRDPRRRERSTRRRDEEEDDRSYYSENYSKKVTKETRYA